MVLNSARDLGKTIARQQKDIDQIKQDLNPNDPSASFPLFTSEQVQVTKSLEIYKRRMTGVFIVGNATYGVIGGTASATFPLTFPLTFSGGSYQIGPICILDHPEWAFLDDCILGDRDLDQYERTLLYSTTL